MLEDCKRRFEDYLTQKVQVQPVSVNQIYEYLVSDLQITIDHLLNGNKSDEVIGKFVREHREWSNEVLTRYDSVQKNLR